MLSITREVFNDRIETLLEGDYDVENVRDNCNAVLDTTLTSVFDFKDAAWSAAMISELQKVKDERSLKDFEVFLGKAIFIAEKDDGSLLNEDDCFALYQLAGCLAGKYADGQFESFFSGLANSPNRENAVADYLTTRLRQMEKVLEKSVIDKDFLKTTKNRVLSGLFIWDDWLTRKKAVDSAEKVNSTTIIPEGAGPEIVEVLNANRMITLKELATLKESSREARRIKEGLYNNPAKQLYVAIKQEKWDVAKLLIEAGADCCIASDEVTKEFSKETALTLAIKMGQTELALKMIEHATLEQLNKKNGFNNTGLIESACRGQKEVVEALIKCEVGLNVQNIEGNTALTDAANKGHKGCVEALIKAGANLNLKNNKGHTALYWAIQSGKTDVAKLLIEAGADCCIASDEVTKEFNKETPLTLAIKMGWTKLVLKMIEHATPEQLNKKNGQGESALILAAYKYNSLAVSKSWQEALIRRGVDLNIRDNGGRTALMIIASKYLTTTDIVEKVTNLLKEGADLYLEDNYGSTANNFVPTAYQISYLFNDYKKNPIKYLLKYNKLDDLFLKICTPTYSPKMIEKLFLYAVKHHRTDLILQTLASFDKGKVPENIQSVLKNKTITKSICATLLKADIPLIKKSDIVYNLETASKGSYFVPKEIKKTKAILTEQIKEVERLSKPDDIRFFLGLLVKDFKIESEKGRLYFVNPKDKSKIGITTALDKKLFIKILTEQAVRERNMDALKSLNKELYFNLSLERAIASRDIPAISALIKQGANVNYVDNLGNTLLDIVFSRTLFFNTEGILEKDKENRNQLENTLKLILLNPDLNINQQRLKGQTVLHAAITQNASETDVAILMLRGADITKRDDYGKTPLDYLNKFSDKEAITNILNSSPKELLENDVLMKQVFEKYSKEEIKDLLAASGKMTQEELITYDDKLNKLAAPQPVQPQADAEVIIGLDAEEPKAPVNKYVNDMKKLIEDIVAILVPKDQYNDELNKLTVLGERLINPARDRDHLNPKIEALKRRTDVNTVQKTLDKLKQTGSDVTGLQEALNQTMEDNKIFVKGGAPSLI